MPPDMDYFEQGNSSDVFGNDVSDINIWDDDGEHHGLEISYDATVDQSISYSSSIPRPPASPIRPPRTPVRQRQRLLHAKAMKAIASPSLERPIRRRAVSEGKQFRTDDLPPMTPRSNHSAKCGKTGLPLAPHLESESTGRQAARRRASIGYSYCPVKKSVSNWNPQRQQTRDMLDEFIKTRIAPDSLKPKTISSPSHVRRHSDSGAFAAFDVQSSPKKPSIRKQRSTSFTGWQRNLPPEWDASISVQESFARSASENLSVATPESTNSDLSSQSSRAERNRRRPNSSPHRQQQVRRSSKTERSRKEDLSKSTDATEEWHSSFGSLNEFLHQTKAEENPVPHDAKSRHSIGSKSNKSEGRQTRAIRARSNSIGAPPQSPKARGSTQRRSSSRTPGSKESTQVSKESTSQGMRSPSPRAREKIKFVRETIEDTTDSKSARSGKSRNSKGTVLSKGSRISLDKNNIIRDSKSSRQRQEITEDSRSTPPRQERKVRRSSRIEMPKEEDIVPPSSAEVASTPPLIEERKARRSSRVEAPKDDCAALQSSSDATMTSTQVEGRKVRRSSRTELAKQEDVIPPTSTDATSIPPENGGRKARRSSKIEMAGVEEVTQQTSSDSPSTPPQLKERKVRRSSKVEKPQKEEENVMPPSQSPPKSDRKIRRSSRTGSDSLDDAARVFPIVSPMGRKPMLSLRAIANRNSIHAGDSDEVIESELPTHLISPTRSPRRKIKFSRPSRAADTDYVVQPDVPQLRLSGSPRSPIEEVGIEVGSKESP